MSLGDTEDPPPLARVEVIRGEEDFARFRSERPSTAEDPFFKHLAAVEERITNKLTEHIDRRFDAIEAELGRANTHATALALDIAAQAAKPNGLRDRSALIVEPDRYLAKRATYALEKVGMRPISARSREDALDALDDTAQPFDVALVNIRIPRRGDGIDLVRFITRQHRFTATFLMGGGLGDPDLAPLLDGLRVGRLPMPFDFETLYERIYDAVGDIVATSDTERPPGPRSSGPLFEPEDDTQPSIDLPSTRPDLPHNKEPFPGGDFR